MLWSHFWFGYFLIGTLFCSALLILGEEKMPLVYEAWYEQSKLKWSYSTWRMVLVLVATLLWPLIFALLAFED